MSGFRFAIGNGILCAAFATLCATTMQIEGFAGNALPEKESVVNPGGIEEMKVVKRIELGPAMDLAVSGAIACEIGAGALNILDISKPESPLPIGRLTGLGDTRQIVIRGNAAFISSRADGAFIVDISNPREPKLLTHYDSVELATGIAISGNLLFIANRDFGVEIVDVSDLKNPKHLSSVDTGEAQSIDVCGRYLYAGIWSVSRLRVVDISNPLKPAVVAEAPLDGFGDGVCVRNGIAYAATGHHRPTWLSGTRKPDSPGAGEGHGLELFDVSNPKKPLFLSRVKFPVFYKTWPDMWSVVVSGGYAFCADTYNGVFVVDVSDPRKPVLVARKAFGDGEAEKNEPVTGIAVADGVVYAAGYQKGLYVLDAGKYAKQDRSEPVVEALNPLPPSEPRAEGCRIYNPGGQVYSADFLPDGVCVVAAGKAGVRTLRLHPAIEELAAYPTEEIVFQVAVNKNRVYAAEGFAGLSIWESVGGGRLERLGTYVPENSTPERRMTVKQVVVDPTGRFALLQMGSNGAVEIIDVSNPRKPAKVLGKSLGWIMYGDQLGLGAIDGRYVCAYSHAKELFWFDLASPKGPSFLGKCELSGAFYKSGAAAFGGKMLFVDPKGGFYLADVKDTNWSSFQSFKVPGARSGKPSVFGDTVLIAERRSGGGVSVIDVSTPSEPKLMEKLDTPGNPGRAVLHDGSLIIPDGYEGLRVYDGFMKKAGKRN